MRNVDQLATGRYVVLDIASPWAKSSACRTNLAGSARHAEVVAAASTLNEAPRSDAQRDLATDITGLVVALGAGPATSASRSTAADRLEGGDLDRTRASRQAIRPLGRRT